MSQSQDKTFLREAAHAYFLKGLNVVLLKDKKPLVQWQKWIEERQTEDEFSKLPWNEANQYGLICGRKIDNGLFLTVLDHDVKNVTEEAISKGKEILKSFPITKLEETPSHGLHLIYYSRTEPSSISAFHNESSLELLGKGKLSIMSPSEGYSNLNDNAPTEVQDIESLFYEALSNAGVKAERKQPSAWFDREDLKQFKGNNPPCIMKLSKGCMEGERNEASIRLASYYLNFKKYQVQTVSKILREWNKLNTPTLTQTELDNILKSAAQGSYVYGCSDPVLSKACTKEECQFVKKTVVLNEEQTQRALKVLERRDLLRIVLEHGKKRLIGEDNTLIINFLEICSGQTAYPISGIISGFSGSGKNESLRAVKPLIPEEWLFEFTTSTPEAVKYIPEEFSGTLVIYEASAMQSKTSTLGLRAVGEGESIETIYPMRDEATGKMSLGKAKTNAKNFITTESDIDIQPDLYRRVFKQSMNPSYVLTRRVCAKELRDSNLPESLAQILHKDKEPEVKAEDFQNALRLQDWKSEAIVFAPEGLLSLVDNAVTKEQQVALRTQFKKILSFIRVLALLNQKNRVHVKLGDKKYVVAGPEDYVTGLDVLSSTILETISRIEKRQKDVLELFDKHTNLDKNKAASLLKVSTVTAAKALKTLHNNGYLSENRNVKPYTYERNKTEPVSLFKILDTSEYGLFYEKELENFLNSTLSTFQSECLESKVEIVKPELFQDTRHTTRQVDKVSVEPIPSLIEQKEQNQLLVSEKTSEDKQKKKDEEKKEPYANLGLSCPYCKARKIDMFFSCDSDLATHIHAWHEEEPEYVR